MILRELAASWVHVNCPAPQVQKDFLQKLDKVLSQDLGCSFLIGRDLTTAGQPLLVYCFCGELFAFQLTPQQAARLGLRDNMLQCAGGIKQYHQARPEPSLHIENIEVDQAAGLGRSAPLTGTLKYRTDRWWSLPLALQVVCQPVSLNYRILYHHFTDLPAGNHAVRFSLSPPGGIPTQDGRPFTGVLPLFFQVCLAAEPEADPFATAMVPSLHQPPMLDPFAPLPRSALESPLGEPYVSAAPLPMLVQPARTKAKSPRDQWTAQPSIGPSPTRFRAISDIRAVLVEVV